METTLPVSFNVELVDVPMLVSSNEAVAMVTKCHASELHVFTLCSHTHLCVAELKL